MITNELLDKVIEVLKRTDDYLSTVWGDESNFNESAVEYQIDAFGLIGEIAPLRNELETVRIMGKLGRGQNAKSQTLEDVILQYLKDASPLITDGNRTCFAIYEYLQADYDQNIRFLEVTEKLREMILNEQIEGTFIWGTAAYRYLQAKPVASDENGVKT